MDSGIDNSDDDDLHDFTGSNRSLILQLGQLVVKDGSSLENMLK